MLYLDYSMGHMDVLLVNCCQNMLLIFYSFKNTFVKNTVLKINEKSFYQNPNALSLLAQVEFKLGNKKEAVRIQKNAIALMKRDLSPDIYSISVKPLEQALKKFEE